MSPQSNGYAGSSISHSVNTTFNEPAREQSPVEGAVCSVGYEQANTMALIDELMARLDLVLRPSEAKGSGPMAVRPFQSPLHGSINDKLDSQVAINERLRGLIDRVTV